MDDSTSSFFDMITNMNNQNVNGHSMNNLLTTISPDLIEKYQKFSLIKCKYL